MKISTFVREAALVLAAAVLENWRDIAGLSGVGLVVHGVGLVYRPAAFIVAGAFLVVYAIRSAQAAE